MGMRQSFTHMMQDYCAYGLQNAILTSQTRGMEKYFGRAGPGRMIQNSKALLFAARHNPAAFDQLLEISAARVARDVAAERAENAGGMYDMDIVGRNMTPWDFDRTGAEWEEIEARAEVDSQMSAALSKYNRRLEKMAPQPKRQNAPSAYKQQAMAS
mgnify:CR=1 FL=1